MNEEFLMPQGEEPIPELQHLGRFVKCIRNKPKKPRWTLMESFWLTIILFLLFVAFTTTSLVAKALSLAAALFLLLLPGMYKAIKHAAYFMNRDYVFFYEKGFVWEVRTRSGKVRDRKEVLYDLVDHVEVKEKAIQGNSSYANIDILYKLTLVGHDGSILFTKSSKYYRRPYFSQNPQVEHVARSAAMKAIEQQMETRENTPAPKAAGTTAPKAANTPAPKAAGTTAPQTTTVTAPKAAGTTAPQTTTVTAPKAAETTAPQTTKDDTFLQPWYVIPVRPKAHTPIEAKFQGVSWLRDITRSARNSLHDGQPYSEAKSREWFESQRARGLRDVFYFYDEWAKAPLQPGDKHGVICWYYSCNPRYFTFVVGDDAQLSLVEKPLTDNLYQKPVLTDNTQQFVDILMKMVSYSEGMWSDNFWKAAQQAREGDLMEAVALSQTGGGIGSFYDTPYFNRELTSKLYEERHHALLYSVNYC